MERNIVGVWRLASTRATDTDGKPAGVQFGPRGMGLVTFTSDGRMMSVLVDGRASLPEGAPRQRPQQQPAEGSQAPAEKVERPRRPAGKQRRDRRGPPQRAPRTGTYEKRAPKMRVPITKEMEEGKAYLRSFGDLLQFQKKKEAKEHDEPQAGSDDSASNANGATP